MATIDSREKHREIMYASLEHVLRQVRSMQFEPRCENCMLWLGTRDFCGIEEENAIHFFIIGYTQDYSG